MIFLVTGAAGFIGFHVSQYLLKVGHRVVGIDNLNTYYEVNLKQTRLNQIISQYTAFTFIKMDLVDYQNVFSLFSKYQFTRVIHLAAQVGVRYSIENPHIYAQANLIGHLNILEACRHHKVEHLLYASSSSVYGLNDNIPFSVNDSTDHPISFYAATKKSNELMSHTYSHLYKLPTTGLRFFTVYGPWGRPDMALFKFTKAILEKEKINLYNYGKMRRDFTYIDDIVKSIMLLQERIPHSDKNWKAKNRTPATSSACYRIYNIGNSQPISISVYVELLEKFLGIKARKNLLPLQPGDVLETSANIDLLCDETGFRPCTSIEYGVQQFVDWYLRFYL